MSALKKYKELNVDADEKDPVERLRAFCSLAMKGQDWLDVERFFDAVLKEREANQEVVANYRWMSQDILSRYDPKTKEYRLDWDHRGKCSGECEEWPDIDQVISCARQGIDYESTEHDD